VFWAIALLGPRLYRPGYLSDIGTIHFARWVTLPGTRDFVFCSNYGGSWEAYLEDFITLSHLGLTGVWSNTVGFPKSKNLVFEGATDGERFKRFARQSMVPTRFWYSAYPELITDMIRANSAIRRGLSGAMTEDDAATWLSHFGSTLRPVDRLVTSEIQSLVFGGLGFLQFGALTLWDLPADQAKARAWLDAISASIAWGDGRRLIDDDAPDAVVQLALSAPGLAVLGLSKWGISTFPAAFLDGMTGAGRERILGDVGANAAENWWWGQRPSHAAVLVYAESAAALKQLLAQIAKAGSKHGATQVRRIDMEQFDRNNAVSRQEPFGFADGVSQPVIKGTYKGLKHSDPLHLVEPGEFILGYPDNRGNLPPVPMLPAIADPDNLLPVLGDSADYSRNSVNHLRDLGCNGSFLVIRQLEQDREAFDGYCADEAKRLKGRLAPPYQVDADFIGAKMVGRWKDGTALVRAPYNQPSKAMNPPANDFMLGAEDSEGMRCPFGAHIRRANPRDSLNPGSMEQVAISNRHRLLRVGRKYAPEPGQKPGLLFMSLVGDIERQFEFVQQTWLLGNVISLACPTTLSRERDPIMSSGAPEDGGFTIPTRDGPVRLKPMSRFVTMRGGGYFFLPGKRLVAYLAKPRRT
jgi:deferrochelatase/peroxidase EfeB